MNSAYIKQLADKKNLLTHRLREFTTEQLEIFTSPATHYRMRAEFRIWHDDGDIYHVMFDPIAKKPQKIEQLLIASKLINQLMLEVLSLLKAEHELQHKLFQIDYLTTNNNQALISLIYHKQLSDTWLAKAKQMLYALRKAGYVIDIIGRAYKQKIYLDKNYVDEELIVNNKLLIYRQIENSFTQPNAKINQHMLEWVQTCVQEIPNSQQADLLELYCGNGNFTIALAPYFRKVLATEISKLSVDAALFNLVANKIANVSIARLSAEEFSQAIKQEREFKRLKIANITLNTYNFRVILVDPPRAGLDYESIQLIKKYPYILYISCNPESLCENLTEITKTHEIVKCAMFDQFPFTKHIETGVFLQKKHENSIN